ncbi:hypothetical protein SRABI128_05649 [Microbacterium sp. Bi128]|nr:hypothetical protein SRABI128_05649 [Microbacterium sp. Bi128]
MLYPPVAKPIATAVAAATPTIATAGHTFPRCPLHARAVATASPRGTASAAV